MRIFSALQLVCACICSALLCCSALPSQGGSAGGANASYADYYSDIDPQAPRLDLQLHQLISQSTPISYGAIWEAFPVVYTHVFERECGNLLGDVYSSKCWRVGGLDLGGEQCGAVLQPREEGSCYNREHVWPVSWWGGQAAGGAAYTDLHHVWPCDGYVNARRGNLPFCNVLDPPSFVSSNGAKAGQCVRSAKHGRAYEGSGWEVARSVRGDMARAILYVSTAYLGQLTQGPNDLPGVEGSAIRPWMEETLKRWHLEDPPTAAERRMNDIIFEQYQSNRNPYIDHPEWVELVDFSLGAPPTVSKTKWTANER